MKKFLAVFLCAVMLTASLPVFASAAAVPAAATVKTADSGFDLSGILSSFGDLFTGETDLAVLFTSMGQLFTTFFGTVGEIIDWNAVGTSIWTALKNMYTDISTTFHFLFAELYNN